MEEQLQQQKRDLHDELINQNRFKMEEYRRDCDISTQLALDTHREKIKMDAESQFTEKAKAYQKSVAEELERERASGTVLRKDRDAMSVIIESQRLEIESLKARPQAQGLDADLISRMRQDIDDLRRELQRSLEAVSDKRERAPERGK